MSAAPDVLYALTGGGLFVLGLRALLLRPHLVVKILGLNVCGAGIFLLLVAVAYRGPNEIPDPVPHAMVLTGIVVAVCGTAVALVLAGRVWAVTGKSDLEDPAAAGEPQP